MIHGRTSITRGQADAVEALYAEAEAKRRSDDLDAKLEGDHDERIIIRVLEALDVPHEVFMDYDGGEFRGFSLTVWGRTGTGGGA